MPTFYPTEDDFTDPITYIESIREKAEPFGMCRVIPPASWKMESKVNEEIRFTTQMQHLHRLNNRFVGFFIASLLVEFMYLLFTRMPGESYRRQLGSLLLYLC